MYRMQNHHSRRPVLLIVAVVFIVVLLLSAVYVRNTYYDGLKPISAAQNNSIVTINSGSSVHDVALLLAQKGLIRSSWSFEWYIRSQNVRDKLQAGSFALNPSMSVQAIVAKIIDGKIASDLFTILPAQRLDQIQAAFVKAGYSATDVQKAFGASQYSDQPALTDKPKEASLEGYLYPESFEKVTSTTPETIIKASLAEMAKALTLEVRAGFTKQGLTVHQGVTLASIVEKEVSNNADRTKVAQVFLKRYRTGAMLGSDVTAFYGADEAGLDHSVNSDTRYNTRLHPGLPPGPISNVSASSLQAVAAPADTDFLYFVTGDDGTTYFAHTLAEHNANIAAHCKKLCN